MLQCIQPPASSSSPSATGSRTENKSMMLNVSISSADVGPVVIITGTAGTVFAEGPVAAGAGSVISAGTATIHTDGAGTVGAVVGGASSQEKLVRQSGYVYRSFTAHVSC